MDRRRTRPRRPQPLPWERPAPPETPAHRWPLLSRALLGLVASITLLAAALWYRDWPAHWLAAHLLRQLDTAAEADLTAGTEQLRAMGSAGTWALVAGLSHRRSEVRDACEQALEHQLRAWRELAAIQSGPLVIDLARQLAEGVPTDDKDALRRALPLALRVLDWPLTEADSRDSERTFACDRILRAARGLRATSEPWPEVLGGREPGRNGAPERLGEPLVEDTAGGSSRPATPLPIASPTTPAEPLELPSFASKDTGLPDSPPGESARKPQGNEPELFPHAPDVVYGRVVIREPLRLPEPDEPAEDLSGLADLEVVRMLSDESSRPAALRELRERGFGDRELRIADCLVSYDPVVREQLADTLPQVRGLNPRPWLFVLARDEDASVRLAAIRWLATCDDEATRSFLRELAEAEQDDEVRQALRLRTGPR
ncbi:MAG: HEAT repeat domain-containing protein [Pirellulaceae bacterium]